MPGLRNACHCLKHQLGAIRRIARTQGRRKPEEELEFRTGAEKETAERKRQMCKKLMGRQRVPKPQTLQHAEPQILDQPLLDFPILLATGPGTTVKIYLYPPSFYRPVSSN